VKSVLRQLHRYIGLALAALWLLEALTGVILVFHRDLDDQLLGASGHPARLVMLDRAVQRLEAADPGAKVVDAFLSGGAPGQMDILVARGSRSTDVVRIDAADGAVERVSGWDGPKTPPALFQAVLMLHKQLLSGEFGHWVIGLSGLVLATTVGLGALLAWPRRGAWRRTLAPPVSRSPVMTVLSWHRAIGLWMAPLGAIAAVSGAFMVWSPQIEAAAGVVTAPPSGLRPLAQGEATIAPSRAVETALRTFPGSTFAVVAMPSAQRPWYAVRVRKAGEWRRVFGTSLVLVDARTAGVLEAKDALQGPVLTRVLDGLYPVHTGEWGGLATRLIAMGVGVWLAVTICFGVALWWARRAVRAA
jgi:uncharacterized iron-regulated membrane protein